jgi:hypothetical protein
MIEITGSREHGQNVTGWQDGRTQARVWWKSTDDDPRSPEARWEEHLAVTTGERPTLVLMGTIKRYVNLELISAELEPPGAVRACPRCDHVLGMRLRLPWCPRCCCPVLRDELERAARVNRVTEGAMDVIDQAVTDGRLPG